MSAPLPQHITYGKGGVIHVDLQTRADNAQVAILDRTGSEIMAARTATVSTIDTTLGNAASKGDTAVNVASNTGCAVDTTCWLQDDPEEVLIRKVANATVHLRGKLLKDHVSGATVEGTRISLTLDQTTPGVNTLGWDMTAVWNINGGASREYVAVEITRYPLHDLTGDQDLLDEDDEIYHKLGDGHDLIRTRRQAASDLIARIAERDRARVFLDSGHSFRRAIAMQWFHNFYRSQIGPDAREMQLSYAKAADAELAKLGILPRDLDQDTVVEPDERFRMRSRRLVR